MSVQEDNVYRHSKNESLKKYPASIGPTRLKMDQILDQLGQIGFQATNLNYATELIKQMVEEDVDIILGFTANAISAGTRELITEFIRNLPIKMVFTTGGGIEEDLLKTFGNYYVTPSFRHDDVNLRNNGINRTGNLLIPNDLYICLEDFLKKLNWEQIKTCSQFCKRVGAIVREESSFLRLCTLRNIPVYSLSFLDGALGDFFYFNPHLNLNSELIDYREAAKTIIQGRETGLIILGAGTVKHQICNLNLLRNGAKYAVYLNTDHTADGSNAGADCEEAISWGKVKTDGKYVKVFGDFTLSFPLLCMLLERKRVFKEIEVKSE